MSGTSDRAIKQIKQGMHRHDTDFDGCMLDGAEFLQTQLSLRAMSILAETKDSHDHAILKDAFVELGLLSIPYLERLGKNE